jgi:hypothetical protein
MDNIFQPFHRGVAEFTSIEGTGIGLALVRKLVCLMGGHIGVDSMLGQGSVFWIDLPIENTVPKPSAAQTIKKKTSKPDAMSQGLERRLLYIEDNPANIRLMEDYVAELDDWYILVAMNGDQGLEIAAQHPLDLIICDINLPGMSGLELVGLLRQFPGLNGDFPIYALSADATAKTSEVALGLGFTKYLTKPIRLNILKRELEAISRTLIPGGGDEC